MDDQPLTERETGPETPTPSRLGLGPAASYVLLGLLAGVAIGWLAWKEGPGAGASPSEGALPGAAQGTLFEGVDISADPTMGEGEAPVTIVEFSDFECPYCARFARDTAPALRRQYGDRIRWVFVNYPLQTIHPRAYDAALAGECAHEQGYFWEWYDVMFSGDFGLSNDQLLAAAAGIGLNEETFQACFREARYAEEVDRDLKEGRKFYILGTPTFFVNGHRLEGAQRPEAFAEIIDAILSES